MPNPNNLEEKKKCKECNHAFGLHYGNIKGEIICGKDGCTRWSLCARSHKLADAYPSNHED